MKINRMSRLVAALCAALLILCALPGGASHAETIDPNSGSAGYINASGVNFRTGPSTKYQSQGKLDKNTAVTVTSTSGNWYQLTVTATGKSGYVFSRYVTFGSGTASPGGTGKAGYINVQNGVNFRTGPSTSYSSMGLLTRNTAVTVLDSSGKWYKLTVDATGKTGYVHGDYVVIGSAGSTVVEPTAGQTGYINATSVNFRTGPSTNYKSQGTLAKNTALTITGASGNWTKVTITATGKSGYVFSRYVSLNAAATPTPTVVEPLAKQAGFINAGSVNFRTGPSSKYKSLGILRRDTTVTVTGSSGNWYQLTVDSSGQTGYVFSRYVTLSRTVTPAPTLAPGVTPSPVPTPTPSPVEPTSGIIQP